MSHAQNVLAAGFTLVFGLFSGYIAMNKFEHTNHDTSQDAYYDLMGYGFGTTAIILIGAFLFFAYRMSSKK